MNGKEIMKCRRLVKDVIRYHTPKKTKEPDRYFHHLLMLYYPWGQETGISKPKTEDRRPKIEDRRLKNRRLKTEDLEINLMKCAERLFSTLKQ